MAQASFFLVSATLILFTLWRTGSYFSYRSKLCRNNCLPPPPYTQKDPFLGLDSFFAFIICQRTLSAPLWTLPGRLFGPTYQKRKCLQGLRYDIAENLWGNGIVVVDSPHWKHGRALIRVAFDVVYIANMDRLKKHTDTFLELLPKDGSTVNLAPLFKRLILDTSSEFIFRKAMGALENSQECEDFMSAFEYAQRGTGIRSILGRLKILHRDQKWWDACKRVTDYSDEHVKMALKRLENSDRKLESQEKGEPHRLTTIATVNMRQCVASTVLPSGGGPDGRSPLYIEKGDVVELQYRQMGRDKTFWGEDANLFKPDRWESIRPGWEYTPFGGGPRTCPGQRLVFTECAYVLVTLLRMLDHIENRDPEIEWKEEFRLTAQSKNGCVVGLIP
ncbi:cytochrome P450 [Bimuria novae-zelandiae CBS 107.79]|uniref:Cytochrome P450 n=1 Tax=Bimuria novae-zelandiae CBS 107.79 TaxID=1447943 RepID=A0A6A5VT29_9PLEO|nr:cytochrome P450 [Bimuria novae-zelandiae CBS 107.79]